MVGDREHEDGAALPAVTALAGRRADPADPAVRRFPPEREASVAALIRDVLIRTGARALVSSAACGADLIALETAARLGLRRVVVLPFGRSKFRRTSVTDRPGSWGDRYDEVLSSVPADDLLELNLDDRPDAYELANRAILQRAVDIAGGPAGVTAVIVWEGSSRGEGDLTARFAELAKQRGIRVIEVPTLERNNGGRGL